MRRPRLVVPLKVDRLPYLSRPERAALLRDARRTALAWWQWGIVMGWHVAWVLLGSTAATAAARRFDYDDPWYGRVHLTVFMVGNAVAIAPYLWFVPRRMNAATDALLAARGLCRSCGYRLAGNVSGVCPECGTPVRQTPDGP